MKRVRILQCVVGLGAITSSLFAQTLPTTGETTTSGFAPMNFSNAILTSTPSNATGSSGISTVFSSSGNQFTFGTGGNLVNPMAFNYTLTGPNTATITIPASESMPETTTNLVFTGPNTGTYTTAAGTETTTGTFGLATIPSSAPIANVSARTRLTQDESTILGFVVAGTMPRRVLIRAVGPALANFGVSNALQNPSLSLFSGDQVIATNDDWGTLMPLSSTGTGGTGGTGSGTGTGTGTGTGSGTTLTGTLPDGTSFTTDLATGSNFAGVGAFALEQDSDDAAFVVSLPPGAYTVVVSSSAGDGTGTGGGGTGTGTGTGTGSGTGTSEGGGEVLVEVYFIE